MKKLEAYHEPVMLNACLEALNIQYDGIYVDATFGGGGHSAAILAKLGTGQLVAFDQDEDVLGHLPAHPGFHFVHHNYRFVKNFLKFLNLLPVDGILADLGISSHQIEVPERGFSYRFEAPLDMRMSEGMQKTAANLLMEYSQDALQRVFKENAELPQSSKMAAAIVRYRSHKTLATTGDLREALSDFIPPFKDFKFWSQVYQALRIEVNGELEALKEFLLSCSDVLKPGGRLVVLTYHSLEDRLVKQFIKEGSFTEQATSDVYGNRHIPFKAVNRKPIEADEMELTQNPRSRSAKLRIAERTA